MAKKEIVKQTIVKTYECEICNETFNITGKPHKLDEMIVCNECYEEAVAEAKLEGKSENDYDDDEEDIDYESDDEE